MEQQQDECFVNSIDIRLVKEQLRLLGHNVADDVIMSFVKGLGTQGDLVDEAHADGVTVGGSASDAVRATAKAGGNDTSHTKRPANSKPSDSKAAPSLPHAAGSAAAGQLDAPQDAVLHAAADASPSRLQQTDQQSPPPKPGVESPAPRTTLDQRCRKFLARLADRPNTRQLLLLQQQQQQQQQMAAPTSPEGSAEEQPSHSGSYTTDDEGEEDTGATHFGSSAGGAIQMLGGIPVSAAAGAGCAAPVGGHLAEAVERLNLTHMAGQQQSSRMQHQQEQQQQLHPKQPVVASMSTAAPTGSSALSRSAAEPQTPLGSIPQHAHQQVAGGCSVLDTGSDVVYEAPAELPRFGFRQGYRPVGIHMPPPPSPEVLALIHHSNAALRVQQGSSFAGATGAATGSSGDMIHPSKGSAAATAARCCQQLDLAAHQPQQQPSITSPVGLGPGSPWRQRAHGLRASSESIIGELAASESAATASRPRRVSRDGGSSGPSDPLFHAPASPTGGKTVPGRHPAEAGATTSVARGGNDLGATVGSPAAADSQSERLSSRQASFRSGMAAASGMAFHPSSSRGAATSVSLYSQQLSFGGARSTAVAPGVRKTDRVARFQQMQQQWSKDRFLNGSQGSSNSSTKGSSSSSSAQQLQRSAAAAKRLAHHRSEWA